MPGKRGSGVLEGCLMVALLLILGRIKFRVILLDSFLHPDF